MGAFEIFFQNDFDYLSGTPQAQQITARDFGAIHNVSGGESISANGQSGPIPLFSIFETKE